MKHESLGAIMERIVNKEVHRLVIIDENQCVKGIISLSDILTFIILKQDSTYVNTELPKVSSIVAMDSSIKEGSIFYDDMMMETDTK
jgi:signal-transduction protein with cAMP-binding, CBS, and nucleotidyltransferase domain